MSSAIFIPSNFFISSILLVASLVSSIISCFIFSSSWLKVIFSTSGIFAISVISISGDIPVSFAISCNWCIYDFAISLLINTFSPSCFLSLKFINTSIFPLLICDDITFFIVSSKYINCLGILTFISKYLWFTLFISIWYSLCSFISMLLPKPVILFIILINSFH